MKKIAVIEDDRLLNQAVTIALEKEGFLVISGYTCLDGLELLKQGVELLLLDINLPDGSGFIVSSQANQIPVIFLTARDDELDMIRAFDSGCEDYIVKPFSLEILKRRIQVVLRREAVASELFEYKDLQIDYQKKQVSKANELIKLTAKEYRLLTYLTQNCGQVLSKEMILQAVWDLDGLFVVDNTVSVTINRLKKKIETDPSSPIFIKNVFGMGYVFGE